jgi:branched-chain amino acid transport system substrate-binding protein
MTGFRSKGRVLGACLTAVLVLALAACGSSSKSSSSSSSSSSTTSPANASALGTPRPARGTPVKIGLLTDGADCAQCGGAPASETPVAEATVKWLNAYMNGLAGHPIQLDVCDDALDPGKASDCANQMIRNGDAAVVIGSDGVIETAWNVLHGAGIPVINYAATQSKLLQDKTSTFVMADPAAFVVNTPIGVAKKVGAHKVSIVVVDLPIATDIYGGKTPKLFSQQGLKLDLVPVPLGAADMTPQAQQIYAKNPNGVAMIVGPDQFCIPAINGLAAVGFSGKIVTISQCLTDATRKAIPGSRLKGAVVASIAPQGDPNDPSMQQYQAVLDKYASTKVDPNDAVPLMVFSSLAAVSAATQHLQGAVTPKSVIAAFRDMPDEVLPGAGGRHFRCDGHASPGQPAVCSTSIFAATLNGEGKPQSFQLVNGSSAG